VHRAVAALASLVAPPRCVACDGPVLVDVALCSACRAGLPWLGRVVTLRGVRLFAPVAHDGPARALVHALKFGGRTAAAGPMAAQIAANAPPRHVRGTLVPVPAHPARRRARGFDQSVLLARALGARTGLPVTPALRRAGGGGAQARSGRGQRLRRDLGITAAGPVPRRAVLVDDVATTGATLAACAGALRGAGAAEVVAVAYARALG